MKKCNVNENHEYFNHLTRCPWCDIKNKNGKDPFPDSSTIGQQATPKSIQKPTYIFPSTPKPIQKPIPRGYYKVATFFALAIIILLIFTTFSNTQKTPITAQASEIVIDGQIDDWKDSKALEITMEQTSNDPSLIIRNVFLKNSDSNMYIAIQMQAMPNYYASYFADIDADMNGISDFTIAYVPDKNRNPAYIHDEGICDSKIEGTYISQYNCRDFAYGNSKLDKIIELEMPFDKLPVKINNNYNIRFRIYDNQNQKYVTITTFSSTVLPTSVNAPLITPISTVSSVTTSADQKTIINSIGMEFAQIPAGEFEMGSPSNEAGRGIDEGPVHDVKISNAFYMGKYEVTQKQWREVMGSSPSYYKGDELPVEQVSWNDVQEFIKKLNQKEGKEKYRLPSEAEWEYTVRAGTTTRYSFGDDESMLGDYAWYGLNSGSKTHDVGQKKPNPWGLYDMHGNVLEWVQDNWHGDYNGAPTDGSSWESGGGPLRIFRGSSWRYLAGGCRSAGRGNGGPGYSDGLLGFRLVMIPQSTSTNTPMLAPTTSADQKIITNSIGIEFGLIPDGEFDMGSPSNEAARSDNEGPVHHVKISNAFYMGKYEVTQKQWRDVMGNNPSNFKGENLPVEQVSWNDVQDFIKKLNEKEGGSKYRLPTEAEWEYAARTGTTTRFSFGDEESMLGDYAWYNGNSGGKTHDVGQKKSNLWGLYDMHGNVWEWVQDYYHEDYKGAPTDGSAWEGSGSGRAVRGGAWLGCDGGCRSAIRFYFDPGNRIYFLGFRLVMVLQTTSTNSPMPAPANTPTPQISTPTVIAEQQHQPLTSSIDTVPTTYLSYVNGQSGFYQVRNLDKPQPRKFTYENNVLNINKGDTLIWENDEGKETLNVISDQQLWNNEIGQIKAGRRINYTFYNLGTYTFHIVFEGSLKRQTIVVTQTDSQISIPTSTDKNTFTNSIGMEFIQIPAGEFDMGSPSNEAERYDSEGPVHHVKISNAFYMGKYEVTQKQWLDVMGTTPSFYKGDDLPVERVSWNEVQDFITKLNEEEGANKYRLPTEAEWEYAARAGTTSRYSFGDDESMLSNYAWCNSNSGNSGIKTQGVGQKKPNPWGLYDMHGNVFEWTQDNWHSDYNGAPTDGSSWESRDIFDRVSRGGSWGSDAKGCTSTVRYAPDDASSEVLGFRLLRIS